MEYLGVESEDSHEPPYPSRHPDYELDSQLPPVQQNRIDDRVIDPDTPLNSASYASYPLRS